MRFHHEHEPSSLLEHEPPVMAPTEPGRRLPPARQLDRSMGRLDVPGPRDPRHLGADPEGITDVFERLRADREVEHAVVERPGLGGADILLNPRLLRDALWQLSVNDGRRPLVVRLPGTYVDHPVGAWMDGSPSADVEDKGVVGEAPEYLGKSGVHDRS